MSSLAFTKKQMNSALGVLTPTEDSDGTNLLKISYKKNGCGEEFDIRKALSGDKDCWKNFSSSPPPKEKEIIISYPLHKNIKQNLELEALHCLTKYYKGKITLWNDAAFNDFEKCQPITDEESLWTHMPYMKEESKGKIIDALGNKRISPNDYIILDPDSYKRFLDSLEKEKSKNKQQKIINMRLLKESPELIDQYLETQTLQLDIYHGEKELSCLPPQAASIDLIRINSFEAYTELNLSSFVNLRELIINSISSFEDFNKLKYLSALKNLTKLNIYDCNSLKELDLSSFVNLQELIIDICEGFNKLKPPPALKNLTKLTISGCDSLEELDWSSFVNLQELVISDCKKLKEIKNISALKKLTKLSILSGVSLKGLDWSSLVNLQELTIGSCADLNETKNLAALKNLTKLTISGCDSLEELDLSSFVNLQELVISDCKKLKEIKNISALKKLTKLSILSDVSLKEVDWSSFKDLQELTIRDCKCFNKTKNLSALKNLTKLNICDCDSLKELDLSSFVNLQELVISGCKKLKEIKNISALKKLTRLEVVGAPLEKLDLNSLNITGLILGKLNESTNITLTNLKKLEFLKVQQANVNIGIYDFINLKECTFNDLEEVTLSNCNSLQSITIDRVKSLNINNCPILKEIHSYYKKCKRKPQITIDNKNSQLQLSYNDVSIDNFSSSESNNSPSNPSESTNTPQLKYHPPNLHKKDSFPIDNNPCTKNHTKIIPIENKKDDIVGNLFEHATQPSLTQYCSLKKIDPSKLRFSVFDSFDEKNFELTSSLGEEKFLKEGVVVKKAIPTIFNELARKYDTFNKNNFLIGKFSYPILTTSSWLPLPSLAASNRIKEIYCTENESVEVKWHTEYQQYYWRLKKNCKKKPQKSIRFFYVMKCYHQKSSLEHSLDNNNYLDSKETKCSLSPEVKKELSDFCEKNKELEFLLNKNLSPSEKIEGLVKFFKSFNPEGEIDKNITDTLEIIKALLIKKYGVCRHRAYLCTLLLMMIDVSAHMIVNADHVFVEVLCKDGQKIKYDLGGGAPDLIFSDKIESDEIEIPTSDTPLKNSLFNSCNKNPLTDFDVNKLFVSNEINDVEELFKIKSSPIVIDKNLEKKSRSINDKILDYLRKNVTKDEKIKNSDNSNLKDYLYIESPNELKEFFKTFKIDQGSIQYVDGPLKTIIDQGGRVLINWNNFTPEQRINYSSIVDYPSPTLFGTPINGAKFIGIITGDELLKSGESVASRFTKIKLADSFLKNSSPNDEQKLGVSANDNNTITVHLFEHNWKDYLYGKFKIANDKINYLPGALLNAVKENKKLHIINPPKDPEFNNALYRINSEKRLFVDGNWIIIPENFAITLEKIPARTTLPKNIKIAQGSPNEVKNGNTFYFNVSNHHQFLKELVIANNQAQQQPGWLNEVKDDDTIYVTESIPKSIFDEFVYEIEKKYSTKNFNFVLANEVVIGGVNCKNLPKTLPQQSQQKLSSNKSESSVYSSNDPFWLAKKLQKKNEGSTLVFTAPKTTGDNLIASIRIEQQRDANASHFTFTYQEQEVIKKLRNGKTVILCGELSKSLYQLLYPLTQKKSSIRLNGKEEKLPGKLLLVLPEENLPLINPLQYQKKNYELEDYENYFDNKGEKERKNFANLKQFYNYASKLNHVGKCMPPEPLWNFAHIKKCLKILATKTNSSNPLEAYNDLKDILLDGYAPHTTEYAYLEVRIKTLFYPPQESAEIKKKKLLALLKQCNLDISNCTEINRTNRSMLGLLSWQILNCLDANFLKSNSFNGCSLFADLNPSQSPPNLGQKALENLEKFLVEYLKGLSSAKNKLCEKKITAHSNHTQQLEIALKKHRAVHLYGPSGIGKTHSLYNLDKNKYKIFAGIDNIEAWLETKPIDDDTFDLLLLDEANLLDKGELDFLQGLYNDQTVFYKNKIYDLSNQPNKKIVTTGNYSYFTGRQNQKFLQNHPGKLHFRKLSRRFLKESVLNQLFKGNTELNKYSDHLISIYYSVQNYLYTSVTLRDLQNLATRFIYLTSQEDYKNNHDAAFIDACRHQFKYAIPNTEPEQRKKFMQEVKNYLGVKKSVYKRAIIKQVAPKYHSLQIANNTLIIPPHHWKLLQVIKENIMLMDNKGGKNALLLRGDSGIGKSTIISSLLEKLGFVKNGAKNSEHYYEINCGNDSCEKIEELLKKAYEEAALKSKVAVILNEANLLDPKMEVILNRMLDSFGQSQKENFMLIFTENPTSFGNRKTTAPSLTNRCNSIYFPPYTPKNLYKIANMKIELRLDKNPTTKEIFSNKDSKIRRAVKEKMEGFVDVFLKKQAADPHAMNTRTFFKLLDSLLDSLVDAVEKNLPASNNIIKPIDKLIDKQKKPAEKEQIKTSNFFNNLFFNSQYSDNNEKIPFMKVEQK